VTAAIAASCCPGPQTVIARHRDLGRREFLQPGDPDHVKFIEIAVGDRQKPHPFEQWVSAIGGFVEDLR